MLSKRVLYAFSLQLIFCSIILANTGNAQRKSIDQVYVSFKAEEMTLSQFVKQIERQTDFRFTYNPNLVPLQKTVDVDIKNGTVYQLLESLIIQTNLSFVQVNDNIHVRPRDPSIPEGVRIENEALNAISGMVTDINGIGIPGVTVIVEGTTRGTVTDVDGNFTINVESGDVLLFSFIGYKSQRIQVQNQSSVNIVLKEDEKALEEVVVVGYGEQKKADVIGAVSQLSSKNIENRQVANVSNILTGQIPGVTVIQRGGRPGASGGQINIRGVGSFGAGTVPLILVDGIPTNTFNELDPNDIESISVLKDASSAAIYGARAANGVILVTTKTGSGEKVQVSYNGYIGFQQATSYPEFVNSWEFAKLFNEAEGSDVYTSEDIQKFKDGSDRENYPNSDFIGQVFTKKPIQTQSNLTINGGSKTSKYNLSLGYLFQDGLVIKNNY